MKNRLLLFALILMLPFGVWGQAAFVLDGIPDDSVVFDFAPGDSLTRHKSLGNLAAVIDTTGTTLWQIGGTTKTGFLDGGNAVRGIMTDTINSYPVGKDDYFILKGLSWGNSWGLSLNPILSFEHRYETVLGKDGGSVELSADGGATWESVFTLCNGMGNSVWLDSFYTAQDTLANGIPAFSGSSNGYIRSRLQLFIGFPLKAAQVTCDFWNMDIWVRFRFLSDSTADTLAGWSIRNIKLENDRYEGAVKNAADAASHLAFSPNPTTGLIHLGENFPLTPDQRYTVRDVMGSVLQEGKLERTIDLSGLLKGLYFVQISGKEGTAVGRVVLE